MARPSTILENISCPSCDSSTINKAGIIDERQRYRCKTCGTYFFTEARRIKRNSVHTKAAALMYIAGSAIGDICDALKASHLLVSRWTESAEKLVSKEPDIHELRSKDKKHTYTVSSFAKIPNHSKKTWLLIELEDDVATNKIIVVSRKS